MEAFYETISMKILLLILSSMCKSQILDVLALLIERQAPVYREDFLFVSFSSITPEGE